MFRRATSPHETRRLATVEGSDSLYVDAHNIAVLFDIRAFPMSRRLPQFNRERMEAALAEAGIEYVWEKDLGGRRGKGRASRLSSRPGVPTSRRKPMAGVRVGSADATAFSGRWNSSEVTGKRR